MKWSITIGWKSSRAKCMLGNFFRVFVSKSNMWIWQITTKTNKSENNNGFIRHWLNRAIYIFWEWSFSRTAADDEKILVTKNNAAVFHPRLNEYCDDCFPTIFIVLVVTNVQVTSIRSIQFKDAVIVTDSMIIKWSRAQQSFVDFTFYQVVEPKFSAECVNFFN